MKKSAVSFHVFVVVEDSVVTQTATTSQHKRLETEEPIEESDNEGHARCFELFDNLIMFSNMTF